MTRACIDTHALVWYLSAPRKLGRRAVRLLRGVDAGRVTVAIPAIVAVELSLLREAGRKTIGVAELAALLERQPAFRLLPLDLAQTTDFALLHSSLDPFDRLILAAARTLQAPLVTADERLHASALCETIWD